MLFKPKHCDFTRMAQLLSRSGRLIGLFAVSACLLSSCATRRRAMESSRNGSRFPNAGELLVALPSDSLPRPVHRNRGPEYPVDLRGSGVTGQLMAAFVVDSTGRVEFRSITFVEPADVGFHHSVCRFLRDTQFRPARSDGIPRRALVFAPFRFTISSAPPLGPQTNVNVYATRARSAPREELIAALEKQPHCT